MADLSAAANRTAAEADRLSQLFARQLTAVVKDTERRLRAWLAQPTPRHVTPAPRDVRQILRAAGYDALADAATATPFDRMATRVLQQRAIADVPVDVGQLAAVRLEAWRTLHYGDLIAEGDLLARTLTQAVARGFGPARQLYSDLADLLDRSEARIGTLYDTAVSIYGRQVEAEQAGDDPDTVFTYMGPVDERTREFCLDHVGRVYTREEIDDLDNGQISNVFLTGGGYSCRHLFMEISQFSELAPLQGTTQRAPEIQQAVKELKEAA